MAKPPAAPPPPPVLDAPFDSALAERYLVYALSTITARSLPDLRDGLKPVHRRLLWAMRLLRLDPAAAYKKSARIVGDVIGKYHPHGDASVYDAMVRLAQTFALRYPLVDGQGNFGNVDGDNAAAYRYTEARLTPAAIELMAGLDEGTVEFRATYNGEEEEPEVFPGLFPNLLANGSSGIAVGMATSIPPHNVAEIVDAATLLIDQPEIDGDALLAHVRGPDFPTGGILVDPAAAIAEAYRTGRGAFRLRARFAGRLTEAGGWEVVPERLGGGGWQLVVEEIPYGVPKSKLIEQVAALINEKKLPILADVRDESDEAVRIVLEPRSRTVDPQMLVDSLYRLTDLEIRVPLNMNVLDASRTPRVLGLKPVLAGWIEHQLDVLRRRSEHRLAKIADRVELLDGYIVAYLNLDRVIAIIRAEDEPKPVLMAEFALTDRQAEAILNMRLRSLRKLEEMELRRERDQLEKERGELEALLASPTKMRNRLKRDLRKLGERYGLETPLGRRRTLVAEQAPARDVPVAAMIEREPVTAVLSQRGWVRAAKGHLDEAGVAGLKYREGDALGFELRAHTTDRLLLFAANGRVFTLAADKLPGARGFGEPVRLMIDLEAEVGAVALLAARPGHRLLLASSDGRGFLADAGELVAETRKGRHVVNLRDGAQLKVVRAVPNEADSIAAIGDNRKLVIFPLAEVPQMTRGAGVQLQRYRDGGLSDAIAFRLGDGLSWPMGGASGRIRTETDLSGWRTARGAGGRMPPSGFPRDNRFPDQGLPRSGASLANH